MNCGGTQDLKLKVRRIHYSPRFSRPNAELTTSDSFSWFCSSLHGVSVIILLSRGSGAILILSRLLVPRYALNLHCV